MQQPLVTLVTPAYNQGRFLAETARSVLAQTYPNIKYIIINDGSTDETSEVMEQFAGRAELRHQKNQGQVVTINAALAEAKGKYFSYLSSDDVLDATTIEKLVAALEADPDAVLAFPNSNLIDQSSHVVKRSVARPFDYRSLVIEQECYIGPGAVWRTEAGRAIGGWNPAYRLAPDREYWMRLGTRGKFLFLDECLAGYRMHGGSISFAPVPTSSDLEYVNVLKGFFGSPFGASFSKSDQDLAMAHAYFIAARNSMRSGRWSQGLTYFRKARATSPQLRRPVYLYKLARMAVSKPIRGAIAKLRALGGDSR